MSKSPRALSTTATEIIWKARAVGAAEGDPHQVLTDLSRGVVVFGKMLEGMADHYEVGGKQAASKLVLAGRVMWGIVEVSVPDRPLYYLKRNWLGLLAFLGAAVVLLGVLNPKSGMVSIGGLILLGTYVLLVSTHYLGWWMKTGRPKGTRLKIVATLTAMLGVLVCTGYYWSAVERFIDPKIAWIKSSNGMLTLALMVLAAIAVAALRWMIRSLVKLAKDAKSRWVRGLAALGFVLLLGALLFCIVHWREVGRDVSSKISWIDLQAR